MTPLLLAIAILAIATLYASVGHAGASGYLAAMALVATFPQEEMKATALTLNIVVATIGTAQFARAGHFHWPTLWPLAIGAIPMAFLGGLWKLPPHIFGPLVGAALLFAAANLLIRALRGRRSAAPPAASDRGDPAPSPKMPPLWLALPIGAALGLLAGLTGTGGGIFLSPLLLLAGWAGPKRTAAVSVVFVLVNSIAGLGGVLAEPPALPLPREIPLYIACAIAGGALGATLGAHRLPGDWIRALLALVLIIAATKLILI